MILDNREVEKLYENYSRILLYIQDRQSSLRSEVNVDISCEDNNYTIIIDRYNCLLKYNFSVHKLFNNKLDRIATFAIVMNWLKIKNEIEATIELDNQTIEYIMNFEV